MSKQFDSWKKMIFFVFFPPHFLLKINFSYRCKMFFAEIKQDYQRPGVTRNVTF